MTKRACRGLLWAVLMHVSACAQQPATALELQLSTDSGVAEVVDAGEPTDAGPDDAGLPDAGFDAGIALPGDTCETAERLSLTTLTVGSLEGYASHYAVDGASVNCTDAEADGPDRVYFVDVPAGRRLGVGVASMKFSPVVNLVAGPVGACVPVLPRCLAGTALAADTATHLARYWNDSTETQRVFVIVDSADGSGGGFTVSAALVSTAPVVGDRCEAPIALSRTQPTFSTLADVTLANDYTGVGERCSSVSGGVDRVFSIEVAAHQRLITQLTGVPFNVSTSLSLMADAAACTARRCLASADPGNAERGRTLMWLNDSNVARTVLLIVDVDSTQAGTFALEALFDTPVEGDRCEQPTPLLPGTPLTQQNLQGLENDYAGSAGNCASQGIGPDRAYAVQVPSGQRVTVTAEAELDADGGLPLDFTLSLVDSMADCSGRVCRDRSVNAQTQSVRYTNLGSAMKTVYVLVDASTRLALAPFSIRAELDTAPAGDRCDTAVPLMPGQPRHDSVVPFTNDYFATSVCISPSSGADRVYTFEVPANQKATVTVISDAEADGGVPFAGSLNFVPGDVAACQARQCTSGTALNVVRSGSVNNRSMAALPVSAVLDSNLGTTDEYTLSLSYGPILEGEFCSNAPTPITRSTTRNMQTLDGYELNYAKRTAALPCAISRSTAFGDRVYAVTIPPGQRLTVRLTPYDPRTDFILNMFDSEAGCEALQCVAGADEASMGVAETLTWPMTPLLEARTVYVDVGVFDNRAGSTAFNIEFTVAP